MTTMWFVVLSLAVYRVTRLWLYDTITEPVRSRVIGGSGRPGWCLTTPNAFKLWLLDLLTCQWCLGVWASFGAVAAVETAGWRIVPGAPIPLEAVAAVAVALALAAVQSGWHTVEVLAGVLVERLDPDDDVN